MRIDWKTMTALAGTLALSAAVANAAPVMNLKPNANSNFVDLARQGGGGGGAGGGGGGGGGAVAGGGGGGGGGGGAALRGGGDGGGGGGAALRSGGDGGGPSLRGGDRSAGRLEGGGGPRIRGGDVADNGPRLRGGDRYADDGGGKARRGSNFDRGDDKRHMANRDHDRDGKNGHGNRHRVFRNGAWVWIYGPDTYAYGDDCWWLLRRAQATGNPYWWDRYNACIY